MTNRPSAIDPFLDLIRLLQPQATLWGAIHASGRWAVGFRGRHDLLFFRVDRGRCLLLESDKEPRKIGPGDFVLIHTIAPFVLASDRQVERVDSETCEGERGRGEELNQIERQIAAERGQLGQNLNELQSRVEEATDWRLQFQKRPLLMMGIAGRRIAVGFRDRAPIRIEAPLHRAQG